MSNNPLRRAKGSGSVRQRGKASWEIRYDSPPDANGNIKKIHESVRGSRRDAEKALRDRLTFVESGSYVPKSQETVSEFMDRWFITYVVTNTTASTQRGYQGAIKRYITPTLGRIALQSLQPGHIQEMYAELLARGLSPRTVLHTHRILRGALNHAMKWGVLTRNPADAATAPRPKDEELEMWDVATIHRFLEAARVTPYHDIYHLAILTGMRRGELLGLHWDHISIEERWLSVATTLQRINGKGLVIGTPKTKKSRRTIALSQEAVLLLKSVQIRQIEQRLAAGPMWRDHGYVFCQTDGKPLHPDKVSNVFRHIVQRAGLPHLSLKGLRHAHATLLLAAGVHPKVVSERLGHSNISITMDIYSHVMPGMQQAAAQAIDERLAVGGLAQ